MSVDLTYKLKSAPLSVTATNRSGTAYSSHTGTPTKRGIWRVQIMSGPASDVRLAHVLETQNGNESRKVEVLAGRSYTTLIAGMTVTLGGTLNVGDYFDIAHTNLVADTVP